MPAPRTGGGPQTSPRKSRLLHVVEPETRAECDLRSRDDSVPWRPLAVVVAPTGDHHAGRLLHWGHRSGFMDFVFSALGPVTAIVVLSGRIVPHVVHRAPSSWLPCAVDSCPLWHSTSLLSGTANHRRLTWCPSSPPHPSKLELAVSPGASGRGWYSENRIWVLGCSLPLLLGLPRTSLNGDNS